MSAEILAILGDPCTLEAFRKLHDAAQYSSRQDSNPIPRSRLQTHSR